MKAINCTLKLSPFFHIEKRVTTQCTEIKKTAICMHTPQINQWLTKLLTNEFEVLRALDTRESKAQQSTAQTTAPFYAKALRLEETRLYIEYIDGLTLKTLIRKSATKTLPSLERLTLALMTTIQRLHQHKCLHLDLSPSNIMIDHMGILKLIDFTNALDFSKQAQATMLAPMKLYYSHPSLWDMFLNELDRPIELPTLSFSAGIKYDLLALVFILYELWSGQRFFQFSHQAIYDAKAKPQEWQSFKAKACSLLKPKSFEGMCHQNMTQASYQVWNHILDQYFYQTQGQSFKEWLEFF